jgi:hypothetical protein
MYRARSSNRTYPITWHRFSLQDGSIHTQTGIGFALDDSNMEKTSDDIRHFLTDKFQDTIRDSRHRHLLHTNWPGTFMVEEVVTKSKQSEGHSRPLLFRPLRASIVLDTQVLECRLRASGAAISPLS